MSLVVFISYSRLDNAHMLKTKAFLEKQGFDVRIDAKDILPGENWKDRINNLIAQADAIIFLLSTNSLRSEICNWEVEKSSKSGKRIIPVVIDPTIDHEVPAVLQELNYLFMRSEIERSANLRKLSDSLKVNHTWLRYQTGLFERAMNWSEKGKRNDDLLVGKVLAEARGHLLNLPKDAPRPTDILNHYVEASLEAELSTKEEELKRAKANEEKERALRLSAESRQLASEARTQLELQPDVGALLAIRAWERENNSSSRSALIRAVFSSPFVNRYLEATSDWRPRGAFYDVSKAISFSESGSLCAVACGKEISVLKIFTVDGGLQLARTMQWKRTIVNILIDESSNNLVFLDKDKELHSTNLATLEITPIHINGNGNSVQISGMILARSGTLILSSGHSIFELDLSSNKILKTRTLEQLGLKEFGKIHGLSYANDKYFFLEGTLSNQTDLSNTEYYPTAYIGKEDLLAKFFVPGISLQICDSKLVAMFPKRGAYIVDIDSRDSRRVTEVEVHRDNSWAYSAKSRVLAKNKEQNLEIFRYEASSTNGPVEEERFVSLWNARDYSNNTGLSFVLGVKATPPECYGDFISLNSDGSLRLWDASNKFLGFEKMESPATRLSKDTGKKIIHSGCEQFLGVLYRDHYTVWSTETNQLIANYEATLLDAGLADNRAFGLDFDRKLIWLDDNEQIARLPESPFYSIMSTQCLYLNTKNRICFFDVLTNKTKEIDVEVEKGSAHLMEFDHLSQNVLVVVYSLKERTKYLMSALRVSLISGKVDKIIFEKPLPFERLRYLSGGDEISISNYGSAEIFNLIEGKFSYHFEMAVGMGHIPEVVCDANQEQLFIMTQGGKIIKFIDRASEIILFETLDGVPAPIWLWDILPKRGELILTGDSQDKIWKFPFKPEGYASSLRGFVGRELTTEEESKYGINRI